LYYNIARASPKRSRSRLRAARRAGRDDAPPPGDLPPRRRTPGRGMPGPANDAPTNGAPRAVGRAGPAERMWVVQAGIFLNALGWGAVLPFEIIYLHSGRGFSLATAGARHRRGDGPGGAGVAGRRAGDRPG